MLKEAVSATAVYGGVNAVAMYADPNGAGPLVLGMSTIVWIIVLITQFVTALFDLSFNGGEAGRKKDEEEEED